MDIVTLGVTILLGLITTLYFYSKWKHTYWKRKGVPQLETEFIYGNAKGMVNGDSSIADMYLDMYKRFKAMGVKYGGVYRMFSGAFLPIAPEIIKDVMHKNFDHFTAHLPTFGNTVFSKNLFNLEGEPWRRTRKQLTPAFTSGKMKMMFETLLEKTDTLGALAGEFVQKGEPVNIKEVLERFTSDVVGSVGFGIECNAMKDPDAEFLKFGKKMFEVPKRFNLSLILRFLGIRWLRRGPKETEDFFKKIVKETIDFRETNQISRNDFMHLMIQLKNKGLISEDVNIFNKSTKEGATFGADDITAQCLIFYLAGFETSATTMTFAILELAQNQEIQKKVRQEATDILKKYNGKMTYDAMINLKYTEMVIEETLRKHPPLSVIPRVCTKDYKIPGTDIVVEKGTSTQIPCLGLHMDPEYFPDPEKFNPERFSEENKKNIKDFTYIPFGEGPRMCLGLRFGLMQTKVGLVSLVRNYHFTLNKKTALPLKRQPHALITTAAGGVWVDIEKVQ